MKTGRLLLVALLVSAYATITVVHINMAQPKPVAEATLDMIEIMTRAFDESEGGEGSAPCPPNDWEGFKGKAALECDGTDALCIVVFTIDGLAVASYEYPGLGRGVDGANVSVPCNDTPY